MSGFGVTLARRVCAFCGGNEGIRLWRWSGRLFVTTHTLCARCARRQGAIAAAHAGEVTAA